MRSLPNFLFITIVFLSLKVYSVPFSKSYSWGFENGNLLSNWSFENENENWTVSLGAGNVRYDASLDGLTAKSGGFVSKASSNKRFC